MLVTPSKAVLTLIAFMAHNVHSVPFEQSKNAYYVRSLSGVLESPAPWSCSDPHRLLIQKTTIIATMYCYINHSILQRTELVIGI